LICITYIRYTYNVHTEEPFPIRITYIQKAFHTYNIRTAHRETHDREPREEPRQGAREDAGWDTLEGP